MIEKLFLRRVCLEMSRQRMNQKSLAEKSGVDCQRISRILLGTTVPRITDLEKFAKALGVPMMSLVESEGKVVRLHSAKEYFNNAGQE